MSKRPIVLEATKIEYKLDPTIKEGFVVEVTKVTRYYCKLSSANMMMVKFACDGYSVVITDRRVIDV